ncbi:MAG: RNA polymerase sigma factor [Proteobacteria bacterium]|nr:RNA polymerase sigma factor [Pseudomonadota bacterium]
MNPKKDIDSITKIKQGDIHGFEEMVLTYQTPLFVYIVNIIQHKQTAEDILQDVFITAYTHLNTYNRFLGKFSTWLYRIARNRCLNEINRKKEILEPDFPELPMETSPAEDLLNKELFESLNEALDSLSFEDRSVFILAECDGLSHKDIARIENIKTGTVKSRLSRTKEKLRHHLKMNMGEDIEC